MKFIVNNDKTSKVYDALNGTYPALIVMIKERKYLKYKIIIKLLNIALPIVFFLFFPYTFMQFCIYNIYSLLNFLLIINLLIIQ